LPSLPTQHGNYNINVPDRLCQKSSQLLRTISVNIPFFRIIAEADDEKITLIALDIKAAGFNLD
jgi:hypothetical protein